MAGVLIEKIKCENARAHEEVTNVSISSPGNVQISGEKKQSDNCLNRELNDSRMNTSCLSFKFYDLHCFFADLDVSVKSEVDDCQPHAVIAVSNAAPFDNSLCGVPECVTLHRSGVDPSKMGVFASTRVLKSTRFGPFVPGEEVPEVPSSQWMEVRTCARFFSSLSLLCILLLLMRGIYRLSLVHIVNAIKVSGSRLFVCSACSSRIGNKVCVL
jgi:hypothetical protein